MADQAKNVMIGLFVLAACAIIIFILLFLHPSVGDEGRTLRVRFADIDKISVGTRVTFAGKPVGEVVSIQELKSVKEGRETYKGVLYAYELVLRVDSGVNVYNTDEIASRTSGLLGEKNVAIIPLPPAPDQKLKQINNEVIYAAEVGSVEETLKEFKDLGGKFALALDTVTETFKTFNHQKVIEHIGKTARNLSEITDVLNKPEKWTAFLDNLHTISSGINEVVLKVQKGEGSVGRILLKDDFYLKLDALLNKGSVLMDDVNHYGILFHLDKNWQRLRARRLNLYQKLSCPQEFRNFFNDEMDEILTSLSRIYMVLEETEALKGCCDIMDNRQYTSLLSELLKRVDSLEENIRLYNQEVVDIHSDNECNKAINKHCK